MRILFLLLSLGILAGFGAGRRVRRVSYADIQKIKSCAPRDTCAPSRNDRNGAIFDFKKRNCNCDELCKLYHDCCVDSQFHTNSSLADRVFDCVNLRQFGSLFMVTKCPGSWKDELVKRGCEDGKSGRDPIAAMPVTHQGSGLTYANHLCAICNGENDVGRLATWRPRLECPSINPKANVSNVESSLVYKGEEGGWGLERDGDFYACRIDPVVPSTVERHVRQCSKSIDSCPSNYTDSDVVRKCGQYTATVFHLAEGYRNPHCALCNGIPSEAQSCTKLTHLRHTFHFEFDQSAFSVLFSLDGHRCGDNEVHDPFFRKCRALFCSPGHSLISGVCRPHHKEPQLSPNQNKKKDDEFAQCPKTILSPSEYNVLSNGSVTYQAKVIKQFALQGENLVVCARPVPYPAKFGEIEGLISFGLSALSLICLIGHFIIACLSPELQNLSGRNVLSLAVAYAFVYSAFLSLPFISVPSDGCYAVSLILYYGLTSAFCWTFVLSWDVWRTLRRATSELRVGGGSQWGRYVCYSLIAWLLPAVGLAFALAVDLRPGEILPIELTPHFGRSVCWFSQPRSLLIFFFGPAAILMAGNLILFAHSAHLIAQTTRGTSKAHACAPSHRNFKLYVRLWLLMGLSWGFGLLAGLVDIPALWVLFTGLNAAQGIFIFIAFSCTSKVRRSLRNRCCAPRLPTASWTWAGLKSDSGSSTVTNQVSNQRLCRDYHAHL